jgi:hypothetical protein
MTTLPPH